MGKFSFKAISTNTRDLKTGLLLIFDETQYLFNIPDGFQRVALERRLNFHKSNTIFLSSLSPDHFGGFHGFYLTAFTGGENAQQYHTTVIGPEGLTERLSTSFCFMLGM